MKTGVHPREKALLHIYPDLAGMSDLERREVLSRIAGVVSSSDPALSQSGYEHAMAAYETILWDRVQRGLIRDPRDCRRCGRRMKPIAGSSYAECPEGCEKRKVYAWAQDYWRKKAPVGFMANSRLVWKIRELWSLLKDYLPEDEQNDHYLAGIMAHAGTGHEPGFFLEGAHLAWHKLDARLAHDVIEALKDRLTHAVSAPRGEVPF